MVKLITYPKRLFDKMVREGAYADNEAVISIGYTFAVSDFEVGEDEPVLPPDRTCLRLLFDDVTADCVFPGLGDGADTECKVITPEQAQEILEFASSPADEANSCALSAGSVKKRRGC